MIGPRCVQGRPPAPVPSAQGYATVARALERRFGEPTWYGKQTGHWWAMVGGRCLVEAESPEQLGEQIMSARRWWR